MSLSMNGFHRAHDLSILNPERQVLPGPQLLHDLVATTSESDIIFDFLQKDNHYTSLTYGDFHRLTDQLCREVREHVSIEKHAKLIVPVIIPQCPELYLAWMAVLKSGAAFCPVSHDVPPERLKFILQDVGATFVLATSSTSTLFKDVLSDIKCKVVSLTSLQAAQKSFDLDEVLPTPKVAIDPLSPAYVMYTSGSTGLPKGVMVSHLSVSQSLLAHDEHLPHFKRFLQFASPTFDVSIFEIFFPLFRGATLVGCERDRMLTDLPATIQALNADAAELTPTVAGTLLRTRKAAPCLKILLTIGEMLTTQVVSAFGGNRDEPSILYAMYGPTEAAIHCTLASKLAADAPTRSIGRPLATVTAFVLKEGELQEIVPLGEPGELAVAGQLADGYLNRPEQNQAAFFELDGYGPVYRTGDRAICHPGGELEIMGRMASGQVKLRGQRVELGEIEAIASKTQGVQLALASIIDDVLVLFCAAEHDVSVFDVQVQCKSWLLPYMRPNDIIFMKDDIPRLASGKIDRMALEHDYRSRRALGSEDGTFETRVEKDIAETMAAELGTKLDRNTSFWSLGLDSLKAIKIASKLRERYNSVNAAIISEVDNIAELATLLGGSTRPDSDEYAEAEYEISDEWQEIKARLLADVNISKHETDWTKILPCSRMQIAMLVETAADEALNFNDIWLRLAEDATFAALRRAFEKLAEKNEILRSGFVSTGNQRMPFVRVVWPRLEDAELSLLHPLQLNQSASCSETEVYVRVHHALYDGWSWDAVMDDLNALLSGIGTPTRTPFSHFCSFEQRQLPSTMSVHLEYWQEKFQDFKPSSFPHLSSSCPVHRYREYTELPISISYGQLSKVASSLRCSRQAILEAAWTLLLAAYLNESDITIGVVSAGRHHPLPGIETVIGPCLSTFPLRIDTSALRTTHDLVNHIQNERREFYKHGSPMLRDVTTAACVGINKRLFDTLCVWQQDSEGADRKRSKISTTRTHDALDYAIVLEFEPRQGKIYVKLTFDASRISNSHAELLFRQLDDAAMRIMSNPELRLDHFWEGSDPSIMSQTNSNFQKFSSSFDLTSTISEVAESFPDRVAIEFVHDINIPTGRVERDVLTYSDLFKRASIIASALRQEYNIRTDDLVCLIGARSIQLYIGILGTILAGAAYICIDPRTPRQRIRSILTEAKCKLSLTTDGSQGQNTPTTPTTVSIADLLVPNSMSEVTTWPRPAGANLAYAVFTSGSTGVPKGVLLTRRNLLSNLEELSRIYPCAPETDRLLQSCSPAFDVSVFEIFWSWHMGMTLCTASNDVLFRDLEFFIRKLNISHLSMTPSVAALVRAEKVPHVKMLVTAGEPMNSKVFVDWTDRGLYQGYGPSETTNICNVRPRVSKDNTSNNVGAPLPNTSIFICQRQTSKPPSAVHRPGGRNPLAFQLVPKGGVGEIWVGGEQVGRGYIDAAMTTKSFLDHPKYGWLYRSGDIGRLLADESLVILGREDDQVKLRGQRIELGEINAVLVRYTDVQDAVSMVIDGDAEATTRLVSFWTLHQRNEPATQAGTRCAIYDLLSEALPSYMIPDALIPVDYIPLTRQGKVDRRNLLAFYRGLDAEQLEAASRSTASSEDTGDLTEDEKIIAAALSAILGVRLETITRNSSFYNLGLDSISAIHLAKRLRDHYPSLEISNLLRNPSVGQLHRSLTSNAKKSKIPSPHDEWAQAFTSLLKDHVRGLYSQSGLEVEKVLPCTPLQESMATASIGASSQAYQNTLRIEVRGNIPKLREAWEQALARHQILRTGFVETDSAEWPLVQVVLANFELPWIEEASQNPRYYDLDYLMLPPWSLTISRSHRNIFQMTLQMHHCLYDAEAMAVLLSEIETSYHGHHLQPPNSFDHYLSFMKASDTDETYDFWRNKLDGASACKVSEAVLPEDLVDAGSISMAQRQASTGLSEFRRAARKLSSTLLVLLQASWSRLLFLIFQSRDVCFGNVLNGRNLPIDGIDRVVAPCFNTLPVRARLAPEASNQELCRSLQQMSLETLPYQSSSLRRIQREVNANGNSLFDTLILLQNRGLQLDDNIWTLLEEQGDMAFPFILEILVDVDADSLSLKLHSEIATEPILSQLLDAFDAVLLHTTKYPQARVSDYSTVTHLLPKLRPTAPMTVHNASTLMTRMTAITQQDADMSQTETMVKDVLLQLKPDTSVRISQHITIFNLGFDSITAVQIVTRLRKQGFSVSLGDVMEAASISNIANLCNLRTDELARPPTFDLDAYDKKHRETVCASTGIDPSRVQHVWPCTPTQSGILSQYLRSDQELYFNNIYFKLEPDVDLSRLRRAWTVAMKMHKMLRAGFTEVDDPKIPFAMMIYKAGAMHVPWFELATDNPRDIGDLRQLQWRVEVTTAEASSILKLSILHAIYDAYSLDVIINDVACLYRGTNPQNVDIESALSKLHAVSADESSKSFWQRFSADMVSTRFPDLRTYNNTTRKYCSTIKRCSMSHETLVEACAAAGATVQALVCAAWASLLSTYIAQVHVTFGVILSGRDFDEGTRVAFPCINTVPLAIEVTPDKVKLLGDITKRCAGLLKHQHTPLNSIKRWIRVEEELFDSVVVLQKYDSVQTAPCPWSFIRDDASAEYAVSLEVFPREDGAVDFQLTFREDVMPDGQAIHILQQYEAIVNNLIVPAESKADLPDSVLSVVPAKEERILTEVRCLHEFVEVTAKSKPSSIALEFVTGLKGAAADKQTWTYSELDANGNRMARLIQSVGTQVGDLVAVCFDKCPEASFAILGALKAGCGYIAIDPGAPSARKQFILEDSSCRVILTTRDKISEFGSFSGVSLLAVENSSWQSLPAQEPTLARQIASQDTCYCLYTSGTTGTPKGCLISHDSAVQAMLSFQRIFAGRWNESSRWLQFASFHFDVSVLEQYWSWSVGICVTSAPRDLLFEDLPGTISALQITHLDLTPSLARLLIPEEVPSLCDGVFIVGGEQVRQDILEIWGDTGCLYNFYGPSEVTIGCTVHRQVQRNAKATNIGQQWDNVGSLILEPGSLRPVLRGAVGELCLSGPLVGKGYLNRSELTAEKFITLKDYDTRVYRTGDLVRLLHDNSFEFLGRIDDQVKLRGQRLEIREINHHVVTSDASIKDVATMVLSHPTQNRDCLVTFFSTARRQARREEPLFLIDHESRELAAKIRVYCAERLPAYMVPTYILAVSSLPLSANNKTDHKVLEALYKKNLTESAEEISDGEGELDGSNTVVNVKVVEVLASFLHVPQSTIKPTSRLFELGLDSISAIGLTRAFKRQGFENASVAIVLRHSVVMDLARAIDQEASSDESQAIVAADKLIRSFAEHHRAAIARSLSSGTANIEHIAPCTPLQEGMISRIMQSRPEDTVYFSRFCFELKPGTELSRLEAAWKAAQRSTSVLRTFFISTTDGYAQAVLHECANGVKTATVEHESLGNGTTPGSSFREWVRSVKSLTKSLPWKVELTSSESGGLMTLCMFHGLYDGRSLALLLSQVKQHYDHAGDAFAPSTQFHETLSAGPLRQFPEEKEFWAARLPGFNPFKLPLADSESDQFVSLQDRVVLNDVQSLCNELDVTTSAFFQALFLYTLHKQFKATPSMGIVVSGRAIAREGFEDVIGPMFNTIPFALGGLKKNATLADLIRACHKFNVDTIPYQHTPLRKIAHHIGQDINKGLFDALFVFQRSSAEMEDGGLWEEMPNASSPDYPLNVEVEQKGAHFGVMLVAKSGHLRAEIARTLFNDYLYTVRNAKMGSILPDVFCAPSAAPVANGVVTDRHAEPEGAVDKKDGNPLDNIEIIVRSQIAKLASVQDKAIDRYGPTIFELGLDSIEAMKLAARLKDVGLRIAVSAIMKAPTVAGIAQATTLISESDGATSNHTQTTYSIADMQSSYRTALQRQQKGIDLGKVEYILPVTSMQEGLLLESDKYQNVMSFKLNLGTDAARLKAAWENVSVSEPILRTRFASVEASDEEATFVQYVLKQACPVFSVHCSRLSEVVKKFKEVTVDQNLSDQRVQAAVVDAQNAVFLVLTMPHALYDAWSLHLLHQQVAKAYRRPMSWPDGSATIPSRNHLEQVMNHSKGSAARNFWSDQLINVRRTILDAEVAIHDRSDGAFLLRKLSATNLLEALKFCRSQGVTLQSLGLACWTTALAHQTRKLDVCFGLVLSGRTTEDSEELIFPTFNTVIFRPDIRKNSTRAQAIRHVHDAIVRVSEYQHFSLREAFQIVRKQRIDREPFNTLFTFQKLPTAAEDLPALYDEVNFDEMTIKPPYPVNIELEGGTHGLVWTVAFQEGVASKTFGHELLVKLEDILAAFLKQPDQPLLRKEGETVSICGLPGIEIENNQHPVWTAKSTDDNDEAHSQPSKTWTTTEIIVRNVLADVSKVDKEHIKRNTGIFHIGLDSVSAIKVASFLRNQGVSLPVSAIIREHTVEKIAAQADRLKLHTQDAHRMLSRSVLNDSASRAVKDSLPISGVDIEAVIPATAGQCYMLDMWIASSGRMCYPTFWLKLSGCSQKIFDQAVKKLVQKMPLLRTLFVNHEDGDLQKTWQVILMNEAVENYELPWRISAEDQGSEMLVSLQIHHALYDAVSLQLLLDELESLVVDASDHRRLNTDMANFISATTFHRIDIQDFWTRHLGLQHDKLPPINRGSFAATRLEKFNPRFLPTAKVSDQLRHYGLAIQALFFAAYARLYSKFRRVPVTPQQKSDSEPRSVVLGVYLANRSLEIDEITQLAAPTFNIVPIRVQVEGKTLLESTAQVQYDLAEISRMENCGVSMKEIYTLTGIKIDTFVNFLTLPSVDQGAEAAEIQAGKEVRLTHAKLDPDLKARPRDHATSSPFLKDTDKTTNVIEWCLPAIDIEAKVEDGYLGMGVFAPEDLLSEGEINKLMDEMRSLMVDFC